MASTERPSGMQRSDWIALAFITAGLQSRTSGATDAALYVLATGICARNHLPGLRAFGAAWTREIAYVADSIEQPSGAVLRLRADPPRALRAAELRIVVTSASYGWSAEIDPSALAASEARWPIGQAVVEFPTGLPPSARPPGPGPYRAEWRLKTVDARGLPSETTVAGVDFSYRGPEKRRRWKSRP